MIQLGLPHQCNGIEKVWLTEDLEHDILGPLLSNLVDQGCFLFLQVLSQASLKLLTHESLGLVDESEFNQLLGLVCLDPVDIL